MAMSGNGSKTRRWAICTAVLALLAALPGRVEAAIPASQRTALIALYNSTGGASWSHRDNWRNVQDTDFSGPGTECTWYGVSCDGSQVTVWTVFLPGNNLTGPLPAEIAALTDLRMIYLPDNALTGSIPTGIGSLTTLVELRLYNNQLTGAIPATLGGCSSLQVLMLSYNQLSGPLPAELGGLTSLRSFSATGNLLSGAIPPQIGGLSALTGLWLDYNDLSGGIPVELGNLSNLEILDLRGNDLTGAIPSALGNLASLTTLFLDSNRLAGAIPSALGTLASLHSLDLSRNALFGPLPAALGNLPGLTTLFLQANRLTGELPASLANLTGLISGGLDLRFNGVFTSDPTLATFLAARQVGSDWQSTQTIAPSGVTASAAGANTLAVSWTPIAYSQGSGGYRVLVSRAPEGPFRVRAGTEAKSASSLLLVGLDPATTYYVAVATQSDPHPENVNKVVSESGPVVSVGTSGSMRPVKALVDPLVLPGGNGVLEPGELATMASSWNNLAPVVRHLVTGALSAFTGPGGATYSLMDAGSSYGTISPSATIDCLGAGGDCYQLLVTQGAARPATHWDATVTETLSTTEIKLWTLHLGGSFSDVPSSYVLYSQVEALLHAGVT
jgi:hypothetical protein